MRRRAAGGLLLGLAIAVTAPACATKKDLKQLRDEMLALQAHQDSLFREVQRQNRLLLDTLRQSYTIQQDAAGQTSYRFQQLEQQLTRTEELMNQMQILVTDVITRLDEQAKPPAPVVAPPMGVDSTGAPLVTGAAAGEAGEAYDSGMEKLAQGAFATARLAFQLVVEQFPNHPLASQAQYQIGQTYVNEGDSKRAIEALEEVEARWSGSARAPGALLQAGTLAEDMGDRAKAKELYNLVIKRYPGKPEYREATRRYNALGG